MRLSVFENYSSPPSTLEIEWSDLIPLLSVHQTEKRGGKLASPAWSPAVFKHPRRLASLVESCQISTYDLDDVPESAIRQLIDRAKEAKIELLLVTSYSHGTGPEGTVRMRVILPLARPYPPSRHREVWARVASFLGILDHVDDQCSDVCRLMFAPYVPESAKTRASSLHIPGVHLEVDATPRVRAGATKDDAPKIRAPLSRDRLLRQAKAWARKQETESLGDATFKVCNGLPFAHPGERDTAAWALARALVGTFPDAEDVDTLVDLFTPSLSIMGSPTREEMRAKFERARANLAQIAEEEEEQRITRIRAAFAYVDPGRDFGYLDHEIEDFAASQGCDKHEVRQRWILQVGGDYRFLVAGEYSAPYHGQQIATGAAHRDLAPAESVGVRLRSPGGAPREVKDLIVEYGTAAQAHVYDVTIDRSLYLPGPREFREASARIRSEFRTDLRDDPEVREWLWLLGGEHAQHLFAWLAAFPDLSRTICGLALVGPPGCGKGLLASALARLWSTTMPPCDMAKSFGSWNHDLTRMPFLWSDEKGMPKDWRGHSLVDEYRASVGNHAQPISQKFAQNSTLVGCMRHLFTANGEASLSLSGAFETDDIAAIAERLYRINVGGEGGSGHKARAYLESLGHEKVASFVHGDRVARYVLWLGTQDQISPEMRARRFLLPAAVQMTEEMTTRVSSSQDVFRFLHRVLSPPTTDEQRTRLGIRYHHTFGVLVPLQQIADTWSQHMHDTPSPPFPTLRKAHGSIFEWRTCAAPGGGQHKEKWLREERLRAWCQDVGYDYEEIDRTIQAGKSRLPPRYSRVT